MKNTQMWLAASLLIAGSAQTVAAQSRDAKTATPPAERRLSERTKGAQSATPKVDSRAVSNKMMADVKTHSTNLARIDKLNEIVKFRETQAVDMFNLWTMACSVVGCKPDATGDRFRDAVRKFITGECDA
jgi:hypothetical protein